jgi:hypothetical protein
MLLRAGSASLEAFTPPGAGSASLEGHPRPSSEVRLARGLSTPSGEVRFARGHPRAHLPRSHAHLPPYARMSI